MGEIRNRLDQALVGLQITQTTVREGCIIHGSGLVRVEGPENTWVCLSPVWDSITSAMHKEPSHGQDTDAYQDLWTRLQEKPGAILSKKGRSKGHPLALTLMADRAYALQIIDWDFLVHVYDQSAQES